MHGHEEDALTLFYEIQEAGIKVVHITFISILSAGGHAGPVDEG